MAYRRRRRSGIPLSGVVILALVGGAVVLARTGGLHRTVTPAAHGSPSRAASATAASAGRARGAGATGGSAAPVIPSQNGLPAVQYGPSNPPPAWPGAAGQALPYPVLIADRGNNRMIEVTPEKQIIWQYPAAGAATPTSFGYDDDTFFTPDGGSIITNEEDESAISVIDYYSQAQTWSYGQFGVAGYDNGHLNYPDDAYRLANGTTITADIRNCRELFISPQGQITEQWGVNQQPWLHYCATNIGASAQQSELGYPNGDTPQANGDILMSIINGNWIVLFSPTGQTLWKAQAPDIPDNGCQYVSDAQLLADGNVLVADYAGPTGNSAGCPAVPGQVIIFNPQTLQVVWRYAVASGDGELDHPSLAEQLPNGNIMLNDDYNDRVIVIDPQTKQIVWQYGVTATSGTAQGYLNTPDGFAIDVFRNWYGWLQAPPAATAVSGAPAGSSATATRAAP